MMTKTDYRELLRGCGYSEEDLSKMSDEDCEAEYDELCSCAD
jgi:hypothetical protein